MYRISVRVIDSEIGQLEGGRLWPGLLIVYG